jgi:hypothetical protein
MKHATIATAVTLILVGLVFFLGSCYPKPPVNPPSCAQDPTQDWCAPPQPPLFQPATCEEACARVEGAKPAGLDCKTDGVCLAICRRVLRDGYRACLKAAGDCDAVSACGR